MTEPEMKEEPAQPTPAEEESGAKNGDNVEINMQQTAATSDPKLEPKTEGEESSAANGENPVETKLEEPDPHADNPVYMQFKNQGIDSVVILALLKLFDKEIMKAEDLDERVLEMMRTLRSEHATYVLAQVEEANLIGVQNRASFLMAVMRNFRDRLRAMGPQAATAAPLITGPDKERLQALLDRTGYEMEVTIGQRKYGGPPPGWEGAHPNGAEVYVGNLPNEMFEDEIIPLLEECGRIYDFRLMMEPMTGNNRGYGFVTYCEQAHAKLAAQKYNGYEIKSGKPLKVNVSVANTRLFLGNIPKSKSKEEILEELKSLTEGLRDVIVHATPEQSASRRNRGFVFVDFVDHKSASDARRRLANGKIRPWNCDLVVDWAQPVDEPDEETMAKVKVLYVKRLKESITEEEVLEKFKDHGEIDHVKKIRDYAFVHFKEREDAVKAMEALQGLEFEGVACDISLAKPQVDKLKKEKQRLERERRQLGMMAAAMGGRGMRGGRGGGGMRGGPRGFAGGPRGAPRGGPYTGIIGPAMGRGRGGGGYYDYGYSDDSYGGGYGGTGYDQYGGAGYGGGGYGGGGYGEGGGGGAWGFDDYDSYYGGNYGAAPVGGGGYDPYGGYGYGRGGGYGGGAGRGGGTWRGAYGATRPLGISSFGRGSRGGNGGPRGAGGYSNGKRGVGASGGGLPAAGAAGGQKRPAEDNEGPVPKKATPNQEDFSADINMTSF